MNVRYHCKEEEQYKVKHHFYLLDVMIAKKKNKHFFKLYVYMVIFNMLITLFFKHINIK